MVYIGAAAASILLLWSLTRARRQSLKPPLKSLAIEELFPHHAAHFDQIHQAISEADFRYLAVRASPECRKRVQRERQQIIRQYVRGLSEDFEHLEQLGRTVAALSPHVSQKIEFERIRLGVRFRVTVLLVSVLVQLGISYARPLQHLARMVGSLASEMDALLIRIEPLSAQTQGISSGTYGRDSRLS